MKVLFITNYASPYRIRFFEEIGQHVELTVLFSGGAEEKTRAPEWFAEGSGGFRQVFLNKVAGSLGDERLCLDVLEWLREGYDRIIIGGYSSPTAMLAMAWLRLKRIPYYMEVDGGLIRPDSAAKYYVKKMLVRSASGWLSSGKHTTDYLVHYGADRSRIWEYPFTSLEEKDILPEAPSPETKLRLRQQLGMTEEKILLYVGRYDPKKGMDDLLHAVPALDKAAGVYFVGGQAGEQHLSFCRDHGVENAHFVGFKKKEELSLYYQAADALVLPTWSDVWGLVVNEAMACGLPVITTDWCVAGLELVEQGVTGFLYPARNQEALIEVCNRMLSEDHGRMGKAALEKIRPYTIENMVKTHITILNDGR